MQVLLALIDAQGAVVTRDELAQRCWQGRFVAEDSLNAAIAELRKAIRSVGSDIAIETVPKTGYRIAASGLEPPAKTIGQDPSVPEPRDRRQSLGIIVIGGAAILAVAAGLAFRKPGSDGLNVSGLIEQGRHSLRQGLPEAYDQAVNALRMAVEIEPANADAWGLLALAWRGASEYGEPSPATAARRSAELAARRSLAINARQSDALTALALLAPVFWALDRCGTPPSRRDCRRSGQYVRP